MPAEKSTRRLLPDAKVCERYGIHISTLYCWDHNPALGFPKPIRINKRKYRDEIELDHFDQARAAERQTAEV
jgi:predicted DNA-binding transcriptional regulator AlpA